MDAQFNLGLMYFRGLSIEAADEKEVALFSQAAEQEHGHGQYSLAVMYARSDEGWIKIMPPPFPGLKNLHFRILARHNSTWVFL